MYQNLGRTSELYANFFVNAGDEFMILKSFFQGLRGQIESMAFQAKYKWSPNPKNSYRGKFCACLRSMVVVNLFNVLI